VSFPSTSHVVGISGEWILYHVNADPGDEDRRSITPPGIHPDSLVLELDAIDERAHVHATLLDESAHRHAIPSLAKVAATERLIHRLVRGELTNPR
jgi:hypothetical protein